MLLNVFSKGEDRKVFSPFFYLITKLFCRSTPTFLYGINLKIKSLMRRKV
jgi:hypothetical protein